MKSILKTIFAAGCALLALLALAACGGRPASSGNASDGNAYASDGDAEYWLVTDGDASAGNAISDKNIRQVQKVSFPEKDTLCLTAEHSRLYALNGKGETVLLEDADVPFFSRYGNHVTDVISGRELWDHDLITGESKLLLTSDGGYISQLQRYETGVVFDYYTDFSTAVGIWDERVGEVRYLNSDEENGWIYEFAAADGVVVCQKNTTDRDTILAGYDPLTMEQLWWGVSNSAESIKSFGGKIYVANTATYYWDQEYEPGQIYELDPHTGARRATGLQMPRDAWSVRYTDGECALVECGYGDYSGLYYLRGDEILRLYGPLFPLNSVCYYMDSTQDVILLSTSLYQPSAVGDIWFETNSCILLDKATGEAAPAEVRGEYSPLFAGGDFPVMDSSTARKPLTAALYSFFCESTGYGGTMPLCSTTHGAWLNIADGKADVALLAAPTAEEQEYLDSKDVEVEMKLYGGDGLVFIGGTACGVEDLTLDQLRAIYRGEITNWKELGGADHAIRVLFRDDQSGSQRLFESLLWKGQEVPDFASLGFDRMDEMSTIVWEILDDPYAIGYSIMTYLNDVYAREELLCFSLEGYTATPENIRAGNYPLGTRGYVVIRADEAEDSPARRLYDFFGSPLCNDFLTSFGITPLSE